MNVAETNAKSMNPMQQYYINGFLHESFSDAASAAKVVSIITDIHKGNLKPGYSLEEKYKHSKDLRPAVYTYNHIFLDVLFENGIPKKIKDVTGLDLTLIHIQLRISYPGESYMDWHRDTHVYGGKAVGNIPPVHKVIMYPEVGSEEISKLYVIPGSHRRQFGNRVVDMLQTRLAKRETIVSSNTKYLLFNTSLLHAVVPEPRESGSWRLIYSFAHDFQVAQYASEQPLIDEYRRRLLV